MCVCVCVCVCVCEEKLKKIIQNLMNLLRKSMLNILVGGDNILQDIKFIKFIV